MLGYVKIGATKLKRMIRKAKVYYGARLRFHPRPKERGLLAFLDKITSAILPHTHHR